MKKILLVWIFAIIGAVELDAQLKCGVGLAEGALIKQRLMENREKLSKQDLSNLMSNRTITYIPLSIHNVENTSGGGRTNDNAIYGFVCGLNDKYFNQDIQFFIYPQIHDLVNDFLDANSNTLGASAAMTTNKIPGTLNIYLAQSTYYPNGSYLSFYSPAKDVIFLHAPMISNDANTEAHEIGHLFTLNHTFYGWEGIDAQAQYNGVNAPLNVGGLPSELVSGSNCNTAADGFCDTPPDFHSTATISTCNFTPATLDAAGATLNPDETNIMSYYDDNCTVGFTANQKAAISADVFLRTWTTNTPPSTAPVTGTPAPISPLDGTLLGSISNSTVRLEWTPIANASWYYIEVYGTNFPGLWLVNTNDVIYKGTITSGANFLNLPTAGLTAGAHYAWKVKALNSYSTCATMSGYSKFEATTSVTTEIKDLPIEKQMKLTVNSNPITSFDIPLTIYSAEEVLGSIHVYAMDGKEIATIEKQTFHQGDNLVQIPAQNIANGMYLAVLTTDRGSLQQKFVIQR